MSTCGVSHAARKEIDAAIDCMTRARVILAATLGKSRTRVTIIDSRLAELQKARSAAPATQNR